MIFISSIVGLGGQAGEANYAASKAGLIGMKSFAKEFASRGITANVVCPGPIETDMLAALTDAQRWILGVVPVGRQPGRRDRRRRRVPGVRLGRLHHRYGVAG